MSTLLPGCSVPISSMTSDLLQSSRSYMCLLFYKPCFVQLLSWWTLLCVCCVYQHSDKACGKWLTSLSTEWELTKHVHLQSPELCYFNSLWGVMKLSFPGGSHATTTVFISWKCKGQKAIPPLKEKLERRYGYRNRLREGKGARPVVMTLKIGESGHEQKVIQEISEIYIKKERLWTVFKSFQNKELYQHLFVQ